MTKIRTYQKTHPWISFQLNMKYASPELWILLGEATSKCEHLAGVPLRPATARELHHLYIAKGALGTTAIEGNILSEEEVLRFLNRKLTLPASKEHLIHEVVNIVKACNVIGKELFSGVGELTSSRICDFNRKVLDGLELDKDIVPGEIRGDSVLVGNVYRGAPPEDCAYLLDRLCEWLNGSDFKPKPDLEIAYALIKAIVAHLYIAWIHPFGDGNGRTARLVEFQILLSAGVPTPAAHLLSNHYNLTRNEYYLHLHQSSKSSDGVLAFIQYAISGFVLGLKEQLNKLQEQQWDVVWRSYVQERFHDRPKKRDTRQRCLVLDLSIHNKPVPFQKVVTLSPRLAEFYSKRTMRTLRRDINDLVKMDLIEYKEGAVRAKREIILAFLPYRKTKTTP